MKRTALKPFKLLSDQIQAIESAVLTLVEKKLDPMFYLLDVLLEKEASAWFLRIDITKKDGVVMLVDCESVSRDLEMEIETLPLLIDLPYNLEVRSPGLFRTLKREREFEYYLGHPVKIMNSSKTLAEGILKCYDAQQNTLTLIKHPTKHSNDAEVNVPLNQETLVCLNPTVRWAEGAEAHASEDPSEIPSINQEEVLQHYD